MKPEILVDAPRALAGLIAARLASAARRAFGAGGRFALAVPGGSVAQAFFPRLADAPLDWTRIDLFWCDERAVPPGDPASNHALARRLWIDLIRMPETRIHRMEAERADLDAAAAAYAAALTATLGNPPRLDLVLLGIGPDGHVASLFPGHAALDAAGPVAAVFDAPKPPARRLTLTLATLAAADRVVFAAFGSARAAVVREAIEEHGSELPAARVARAARRPLFLLDPGAACRLTRPPG